MYMHDEEDFKVVEAMEKYGGGFVKSLAQCFFHADMNNFAKLKETFSEYWEQYRQMADMKKQGIRISALTIEDVGRWVEYVPNHGGTEQGRIKSWNEKFIFVVYKCNNQWDRFQDYTGQATSPEDLRFIDR